MHPSARDGGRHVVCRAELATSAPETREAHGSQGTGTLAGASQVFENRCGPTATNS